MNKEIIALGFAFLWCGLLFGISFCVVMIKMKLKEKQKEREGK